MKSNLLNLFMAALLVGTGFILGHSSGKSLEWQEVAESQVVFFHLLQYGEVSEKIRTYKMLIENPESAAEYLQKSIAIPYRRNMIRESPKDDPDSVNQDMHEFNSMIENFLIEHPLKECEQEPKELRVQCSLENVLPGDKS